MLKKMNYYKFLKRRSENFKKFFEWSLKYCEKHDKILEFRDVSYLREDGKHIGNCDGNKIIMATKDNKRFEEIYAHEFCHLMQAVEHADVWVNTDNNIYNKMGDGTIQTSDWNAILSVIAVERDCEKRVLALSKKWGLFDNEMYIQNSNLYMHFYHYVYLIGRWPSCDTIYKKQILDRMPTKLLTMKDMQKIDMSIMLLFDKYL